MQNTRYLIPYLRKQYKFLYLSCELTYKEWSFVLITNIFVLWNDVL